MKESERFLNLNTTEAFVVDLTCKRFVSFQFNEISSHIISVSELENVMHLDERVHILYCAAAPGPRFSLQVLNLAWRENHVKFLIADLTSNITHIVTFLETVIDPIQSKNSKRTSKQEKLRRILEDLNILYQFVEAYVGPEDSVDYENTRRDMYILDLAKLRYFIRIDLESALKDEISGLLFCLNQIIFYCSLE